MIFRTGKTASNVVVYSVILFPDKTIKFYQEDTAFGVVVFMIFGIENHENPSHYDLHIKFPCATDAPR